MNKKKFHLLMTASIVFFAVCCSNQKKDDDMPTPPDVKKIEKKLTIHGDTRIDHYYWLRERDNPEVINYLKAENAYTKEILKPAEELQEKLYNEIVGRIKQDDESVPYRKNGYYYYTRYEEGKEYPLYCRKKGSLKAKEEIMLNANEMAEGHDFFSISGHSISPDNKMIAFGVDTVGRRKYSIKFKNLENGEILEDELDNTTGNAAWADDNRTIFYTLKDKALRPYKVFKHVIGSEPAKDKEIYHEDDETFVTYAYRSKSQDFIMIGCRSTMSDEYWYLPSDTPESDFQIIQPRERGLEYSVSHYGDYFYIVTNLDAQNFRLMKAKIDNTSKEYWQEVIPHREDVLLSGIEIFKDYLVVEERKNGLAQINIKNWNSDEEHYLDFGEETYLAYPSVNPEFDTEILRYKYTSLTTPSSTYDYNMKTQEKVLKKQQEVLGGFDSDDYTAKRLYATAHDGVKIPISLVYKKDTKIDGNSPCLLYSYGSYGASTEPYFSSARLSLLNRGFVFAMAHIRGGQEMGRYWYEDGKLLKKKNTFKDFISCAEKIIEENYTNPDKLFAMGGSAGGLLMGAIANMRPELFEGIIAAVPFVDVVTTMLDESIPLTTGEYDEWGNPNKKEYYDYMLSYSPYDNVEAKEYPHMLVTTGLHDSQVQYWEPAKWVAKLRDMKTDDNLLLLHTNMEAGHGGASGRFRRYRETAMEYAFMLSLLDIYE